MRKSIEAVVYCRISSKSQVRGHGLERQLESCLKYCKRHKYCVVAVFSDVASGEASRPGLDAALTVARYRGATLVCESPCRFTRIRDVEIPNFVEFSGQPARILEQSLRSIFTQELA